MLRLSLCSLILLLCACDHELQVTEEPVVKLSPRLSSISNKAVDIVGGGLHVCAHLDDNRIRCWGDNEDGQCNLKKARNASGKFYDVSNARFSKISAGDVFNCGILKEEGFEGIPICFGKEDKWLDVPHEKVKDIAAGPNYTCFINGDDRLSCVGMDLNIQSNTKNLYTIKAEDLPKHGVSEGVEKIDYSQKTFKSVKAGLNRVCAQDVDGFVFCMGSNARDTGGSIKQKVLDYDVELMGTLFILEDGKLAKAGYGQLLTPIENITDPHELKYKRFFGGEGRPYLLTSSGNIYTDGSNMPENTLISFMGKKEEGVLAAAAVSSSCRIGRIRIRCVVKENHKVQCKPESSWDPAHKELDNPVIKDVPKELVY